MTYWDIGKLKEALKTIKRAHDEIRENNDYAVWPIRGDLAIMIVNLQDAIKKAKAMPMVESDIGKLNRMVAEAINDNPPDNPKSA